ncbi:MAG: hypothetical protein PGN12_07360 [Sphingomonas phyllosphaerae]
MGINTSRRTLIGTAGLSVIAVAATACASTAGEPASDGASLDLAALIANAKSRDGVVDQHQRFVLDNAVGQKAINAAIDENNALNDAYAEALDAVAVYPAATLTDLRTKLTFMIEHQMGDGRDWLREINADVLRISSAEGR